MFEAFDRDGGLVVGKEPGGGERESAMVFSEREQGGPIERRSETLSEGRGVRIRLGTLQKERPFGIENFSFAGQDVLQSKSPNAGSELLRTPDCIR